MVQIHEIHSIALIDLHRFYVVNRYNLARAKLEYLLSFAEGFAHHAQPDRHLANVELEEIKLMNTSLATRPRWVGGPDATIKPADLLDWLDGCSPDIQLPHFPLILLASDNVGDGKNEKNSSLLLGVSQQNSETSLGTG
jgi:hypothetical protein